MLMDKSNFENLEIYQLASKLSDKIWQIVSTWDYFAKDTIGKQLVRASDSIGANIAEGSGHGSATDNRRFLRIARGSLYETRHWLFRAKDRKLFSEEQIIIISPLIKELTPKLNACLGRVDETARKKE